MDNVDMKFINEIGVLSKGLCIIGINNLNNDNLSEKKLKILSITDIKKIDETGEIKGKYIDTSVLDKKYKRDDCYVQKNDIVISIFPRNSSDNVYYIENDLPEKCIYNDTVFVLRCDENIVNAKYVYEILKSDFYTNKLADMAENCGRLMKRLTMKELLEVKIPILPISEQEHLLEEIEQAKLIINKVNKKINDIAQCIDNK